EHPPERLRTVSAAAEFGLCAEETSVIAWPEHLGRIVLDGPSQHVTELAEGPVPTAACVLHTSGSTGRPKPVLLEHAGLADRTIPAPVRHHRSGPHRAGRSSFCRRRAVGITARTHRRSPFGQSGRRSADSRTVPCRVVV